MGDDWRQDIARDWLNDQDFLKALKAQKEKRRKAELRKQDIKWLLLPKNEEALREFLMQVASELEARGSKFAGLGAEGWVDYFVKGLINVS